MATDEIRELARYIRIYYNLCILNVDEDSEDGLNPIDFRAIKTPSEWNTKASRNQPKSENYQRKRRSIFINAE